MTRQTRTIALLLFDEAAGLLDGLTVTTHWADQAELRRRFPALTVVDDTRYLDHGHVATSAGVSAGIDLALHLVARLVGDRHAAATARQMDYPWAGVLATSA
jgi:transcriptional regulator GlxA family with amidase domain